MYEQDAAGVPQQVSHFALFGTIAIHCRGVGALLLVGIAESQLLRLRMRIQHDESGRRLQACEAEQVAKNLACQ